MTFFDFGADIWPRYARARGADAWPAAEPQEPPCPGCYNRKVRYCGEMVVDVEGGHLWPDLMCGSGVLPVSFLVSERVVEALHEAGVTSFDAQPVRVGKVKGKKLRQVDPPKYYYLNVLGEIDLDWEASGLADLSRCPVCRRRSESSPGNVRAFVPLLASWDGSDLFQLRNYGGRRVFCTEKVLLLAREHRWINCQFEAMDLPQDTPFSSRKINYLGKRWPVKYYPDPPHLGKSAEEWVQEYCSADGKRQYKAICALESLKGEAIPLLSPLLDSAPEGTRVHLAHMLLYWRRKQVAVPDETIRRCAEIFLGRLDHESLYERHEAAQVLASYFVAGVIALSREQLQLVRTVLSGANEPYLLSKLPPN